MSSNLMLGLGVLALLGLWMLGAHNRVTALRAAVLNAWAQLDQVLSARAKALGDLLAAVAQPLATEAAATDAVSSALAQVQVATEAMRRRPVAHDTAADLSKADAVLAAVLVRLLALVEQQPALLADPAVRQPLQALRELPGRLVFARQTFNDAGLAYNAATRQFPTRLLRSVFRFGEVGRV